VQIAITGIGIISALGKGVEANRKALLEGKSGLRQAQILSTEHTEWPIGEVRFTNAELKEQLSLNECPLTRNVLLGMVALREAIEDAHLSKEQLSQTPFINGTTVGGMDLTEQLFAHWSNGDYSQLPLIAQHEADQTTQILVDQFALLRGITISTACSSALNAIMHGANLLRLGLAERVIVGGTEAMTKFHLNGFACLGILSTSICKPFQEDRDGINLGEGAAYLVLEDANKAHQHGANIYGYIGGYGNACDAYHQTASSPDGDGAQESMRLALSMANLPCEKIAYINAHGTATPNNDASELCAINRLFGEHLPIVESTKPLTGHTTSASGSIEAIFTLIKMHEYHYPYAISNAFGFGGNDSSIVLSSEPIDLPEVSANQIIQSASLVASTGELEYKDLIPAMQARRMTPLIRQLLVVAKRALQEAKMECPDGIVVGTRWGGMIPTVQLLNQLVNEGEKDFSPALFMNSSHNSAAGTVARFLQCKGYNTTVVSTDDPYATALYEASIQLHTKRCRNVLVCSMDELDETWQTLAQRAELEIENKVRAKILWLD